MHSTIPVPPPLRSEDEIIATWRTMGPPVVSICCTTYNHAPYIKDALQGFLAQVTTFPFEIIVRDDASTDGTTEIVLEYSTKYPRIIRAILEEENQYSKGVDPILAMIPSVRGMYVALCEGDDYWITKDKLEKQVELLRRHPQTTMSVAYTVICRMQDDKSHYKSYYEKSCAECEKELQDFDDIKARHFHTSTYVIRAEIFREVIDRYLGKIEFTDTALKYMLVDIGPFALLKEVVSVYRITGKGIWTSLAKSERKAWEIRRAESFYHHFNNPAHRHYLAGRLYSYYRWMLLHGKWSFNQRLWFVNLIRFLYFALRFHVETFGGILKRCFQGESQRKRRAP